MKRWIEAKANRAAEWCGCKLQQFGVGRGLMALLGGLVVIWVGAALFIVISVGAFLWSVFA